MPIIKRKKKRTSSEVCPEKGHTSDDAPIESFHSTQKTETFGIQAELGSSTSSVIETVQNSIKYYKKIEFNKNMVTYLI